MNTKEAVQKDIINQDETLKTVVEAFKKKETASAVETLTDLMSSHKSILSSKPQDTVRRKQLEQCWDCVAGLSFDKLEMEFPAVLAREKKARLNILQCLKTVVMDHVFENDWRKQCMGKFGGPKPANLSWKEFYFLSEEEADSFEGPEALVKWAVDKGHLCYLDFLLSENPDINLDAIRYENGQGIFSRAICLYYKKMTLSLYDKVTDKKGKDDHGWTPLHYAVYTGNKTMIKFFLQEKVPVNQKDALGMTPLHIASYKNSNDSLKFLLSDGAKVNIKDYYGRIPLHYSLMNMDLIAAELLIQYGADINVKDAFGATLLHWAAFYGNSSVIKLLIDHDVQLDIKDKFGRTAVHYAAQNGHLNCLDLCIKAQANINSVDKFKESPLLVAAYQGNGLEASLLYENGGR